MAKNQRLRTQRCIRTPQYRRAEIKAAKTLPSKWQTLSPGRRGAKLMWTGCRKKPTWFMNVGFYLYHSDFEVFKRETFPAVKPDGNNS